MLITSAVSQPVLPNQQFWVFLVGAFVPLAGYWINKVSPWKSEQVKGIVQVVLAAIAGVLYNTIFGGVTGVGDFFQQCATAVLAALLAHKTLWQPSGLNLTFGANPPHDEDKPVGNLLSRRRDPDRAQRARPS